MTAERLAAQADQAQQELVQLKRQQAEDAAEAAEQGELLLAGQRDVRDAVESQQLQLEQLKRELADSTVEHVLQVSGDP